jgi:hypothetical protein
MSLSYRSPFLAVPGAKNPTATMKSKIVDEGFKWSSRKGRGQVYQGKKTWLGPEHGECEHWECVHAPYPPYAPFITSSAGTPAAIHAARDATRQTW